mmetsp:Transcript_10079/g.13331  ORF Transcript_10079/g.13331 Transcript_10079/m.13331 type:complete len:89 (-) Transcript_10079:347-613(-)
MSTWLDKVLARHIICTSLIGCTSVPQLAESNVGRLCSEGQHPLKCPGLVPDAQCAGAPGSCYNTCSIWNYKQPAAMRRATRVSTSKGA